MAWKADSVQGVIFPLLGTKQQSSLDLWRMIFPGTEPDAYQGAGPSPVGVTHASGKTGEFQLNITAQIGRIDFLLMPDPNFQDPQVPPQIENFPAAMDKLVATMSAIFSACRVARVATVVQFSVHLKTPAEATAFITEQTGIKFPRNSTDNIYQTNVQRPYKSHPSFIMNRVCTFNNGTKQLINAQIDFGQNNMGFTSAIVIPVATLKLDLNSATNSDITQLAADMVVEQRSEIDRIVEHGLESLHV